LAGTPPNQVNAFRWQRSQVATLVEHELDVLMPTPAERHHEAPSLLDLAIPWVEHPSGVAEVHLGLLIMVS
jgi:hypothetical protein